MRKFERTIWILVVAALAAWGNWKRTPPRSDTGNSSNPLPAKSSGRPVTAGDRAPQGGTGQRGHTRTASQVRAAIAQEDPLQRLSKFLDLLANCDADGLAGIMAEMETMRGKGMHLPLEERLLDIRAGQLKGSELLSQRSGSARDREELETIKAQYEGWLQSDASAAQSWLATLPPGRFHDQLAITAIGASASTDPAASLLQAASLHPSQQKAAGQNVADRLLESGPLENAAASFETMKSAAGQADSAYLAGVFGTLLAGASEQDPAMAAALAEGHVHEAYADSASLAKVSAKMAGSDPAAALQWSLKIEGMKGESAGSGVAAAAIRGMDLDHLAAAEEWSAAHAGMPGVDRITAELGRRRNVLEDQGSDDGGYDRDD